MEIFSRVLNIIDQYISIHLSTTIIQEYVKDFEMGKTWLNDNDKETDIKVLKSKRPKEVLKFCVYCVEKITHQMISDLRDNFVLSDVGYKIGSDNDNEKDLPPKKHEKK